MVIFGIVMLDYWRVCHILVPATYISDTICISLSLWCSLIRCFASYSVAFAMIVCCRMLSFCRWRWKFLAPAGKTMLFPASWWCLWNRTLSATPKFADIYQQTAYLSSISTNSISMCMQIYTIHLFKGCLFPMLRKVSFTLTVWCDVLPYSQAVGQQQVRRYHVSTVYREAPSVS